MGPRPETGRREGPQSPQGHLRRGAVAVPRVTVQATPATPPTPGHAGASWRTLTEGGCEGHHSAPVTWGLAAGRRRTSLLPAPGVRYPPSVRAQ